MKIVTVHGEGRSLFHLVDDDAPEGEQPAVVRTCYSLEEANVAWEVEMAKKKEANIADLSVYQGMLSLGTRLYALKADENSAVHAKLKETALSGVLNLASGLGFWEKQWKIHHLKLARQALLEMMPLLELKVALGELKPEMEHIFGVQIRELSSKIQKLIWQAGKMKEEE